MTTTSTDPIADMLSRIRNAIAVGKTEVILPHSKVKESIASILKDNDFIDDVNVKKHEAGKVISIIVNSPQTNARITEIVRLSRPGRRHYAGSSSMPKIKQGRGIVIVSTSAGIMTGAQAISKKVGGELICKVY